MYFVRVKRSFVTCFRKSGNFLYKSSNCVNIYSIQETCLLVYCAAGEYGVH